MLYQLSYARVQRFGKNTPIRNAGKPEFWLGKVVAAGG